ncbi:RNA polymerase I-specific transcription initiation factor RRN6-like protein [Whalleya microplaca]|nr:RNA polymerase I-specific transcription initiation factor RRN6-like protein [Whalleya microplaca]
MTNRHITESSIGLAGRLSHIPYEISKAEDRGWQTTRNFAQDTRVFKELGLHKAWHPTPATADIQYLDTSAATPWQTSRSQQRWLLKNHPEARLGNEVIHDELGEACASPQIHGNLPWHPSLFAIGELTDISEPRQVSGAPLVAVATGEANDVLRLAKPSIEEWQWGEDESVSLRLADLEKEESALWEEEAAGAIRRLKCIVDSKRYDPTRWLVVQRDSGTHVFQPEYLRAPSSSQRSADGSPSRIAANPLFRLSKDQTGGNSHCDVSFNPGTRSNPPQLGIIDECGFWSVWDVTQIRVKTSRKPKISLTKCGHIEKGVLGHLPHGATGKAQWHKIMWIGRSNPLEESYASDFDEDSEVNQTQSVSPQVERSSTLLICNSKEVKILDLTSNKFLPNLDLVREGSLDFILDVHENPQDPQYVFILTSSRLLVVRVYSTPGQNWDELQKQGSIILSCPHFRNGYSQTLKLTVAPGVISPEKTTSLVYIYSSGCPWLDLFCVNMMKADPARVTLHSEAITPKVLQDATPGVALHTMYLHPLMVTLERSNTLTHSARTFAQQRVRFYQLVALKTDMTLVSSLYVSSALPIGQINPPDHKVNQPTDPNRERRKILKHTASRFVVPDDIATPGNSLRHSQSRTTAKGDNNYHSVSSAMRRSMRLFYEHLGTMFKDQAKGYIQSSDDEVFGSNPFDFVYITIEEGIEKGVLPATTLLQMMKNFRLPDDMSLASVEWGAEIDRLQHVDPDTRVLDLNQLQRHLTPLVTSSLQELYSSLLDMTAGIAYDSIGDDWTQVVRLAVFRKIACDLYLSNFGIVQHKAGFNEPQQSMDNMLIDSQQESRASSPISQSQESTTGSTTSKTEAPYEDPTMTLLRTYTGTGKYVPNKRLELLDKWELGANPTDYVFDLDRSKEETPGMQRRARQLARESRKRRRAETLLQNLKDREPTLPSTQPAPDKRFFPNQSSQPTGEYSQSQLMSDPLYTMSQPVAGTFGRRDDRPKKKVKKRKGGF